MTRWPSSYEMHWTAKFSWDVFYKLLILIASQRPRVYEESDAVYEGIRCGNGASERVGWETIRGFFGGH
jgi:hypothetical protein